MPPIQPQNNNQPLENTDGNENVSSQFDSPAQPETVVTDSTSPHAIDNSTQVIQSPPQSGSSYNNNVLGRRVWAYLIDLVPWIVAFIIAAQHFGQVNTGNSNYNANLTGVPFAIFALIWLSYYILLEWLAGGSLGKLIVGIRVRNEQGGKLNFAKSLVRNLLRLVDGFPYIIPNLVGFIIASTNDRKQRLGDKAARTVVVKADKAQPVSLVALLTLLVLTVAGIVVIATVPASKANTDNTVTTTSANTAALSPYDKCFQDYSDTNLCHYYATSLTPKANIPVTVTSTVNLAGHQTVQTSEVDSSGNSKGGEPGLNVIEVNGVDYVQTGTGPWVKQPATKSQPDTNPAASANTFGIDGTNGSHATFTAQGTVSCGALTCYKYEVNNCCSIPTTEWFSFDTKTYRLAENYVSNNLTTTDTTYNYSPVPAITAPTPVAGQ